MAIKTHKVTLSLDNPRVIQSGINVQSFDKQSIQISIELTKNDEVFQVPSDATIRVSLLKLARQEQKIIVDVPNTNRDSIDWIVPDYLDGYQGTVRVGVYLVSDTENVDLGYFTILSNVSDIDKMADEFVDNVFQGWEQIEADLNELNLTIAQTKLDLADDLTQIDNTIAQVNTLASDFTADVATKQADVTSKYNAFDTSVTTANQTIDDILALQPQFQSVLDETTGKDVISAPEIILARGGAQTLGERLNDDKAEALAKANEFEADIAFLSNGKSDKSAVNAQIKNIENRISDIVQSADINPNKDIEIVDARDGKETLGSNIRVIKDKTKTNIINKVTNADFANGAESWVAQQNISITAENGELTATATGQYGYVQQPMDLTIGHKYYFSAEIKATHVGPRLVTYDGTSDIALAHSGSNKFEKISTVFSAKKSLTNNINVIRFRDYASGGWQPFVIKNVIFVDLTESFGAGEELKKVEMDALPHWTDTYPIKNVVESLTKSIRSLNSLTKDGLIPYEKTDFVIAGKNLYNKDALSEKGRWVNYLTGVYQSYPANPSIENFYHSDKIVVKPSKPYTRIYGNTTSGNNGTVFFDSSDNFISGTTANTFTTPDNVAYLILNVREGQVMDQLEEGSVATEYHPFELRWKYGQKDALKIYELNLPPKIYSVVGKEVNIYFDNLMIDDAKKYNLNVDCSVGRQQDERWTATPTAVGTASLSIAVHKDYSDVNDALTRASSSVVTVAENAGSGVTKTYLQIGDSTTWDMMLQGHLSALFNTDVMNLTQIGTRGTAPNLSEGHPAKDAEWMTTSSLSPFVFDGSFNFAQYMTTNGFSGVDYVGIHLGINDVYAMLNDSQLQTKITNVMARFEQMVANIHAYNPNIKIGILATIPPGFSQDGFGKLDANGQTRWRFKKNVVLFAKQLINQFKGRETSNIYVVPFNTNLDTVNNVQFTTPAPANSRSTINVSRQNDGLHPGSAGYAQMADTVYYWIKNMV